jgi:hypothetical protein
MSEPLYFSAAAATDTSHATREATQNADHLPSGGRPDFDFSGVVRLPDYYTDAPQAWFWKTNSIFAAA